MNRLLDISFNKYCTLEGVNWSTLGDMRFSPLHYQHRLTTQTAPTEAQRQGNAVHTAILEPDTFAAAYAIYDGDGTRASREYKAFAAENAGRIVVKAAEIADVAAIRSAVLTHPVAGPLFKQGYAERSFQWTDYRTKLVCKGRTDWLAPAGDGRYDLVDLKTARTTDARKFGQAAAQYGYHNQSAHYDAGLQACGLRIRDRLIVVVESAAPFDVAVFLLDSQAMEKARDENADLLDRVAACRESGKWPGRFPEITPLDLPAYVLGSDDITGLADAQFGGAT